MAPFRTSTACTASPTTVEHVWFAAGDKLNALDPASGNTVRSIDVAAPCRHRVRRPAPVPDRRRPHPQDRSAHRPRARAPSLPPAAAATRGWPGPKARSGSASTASARSTRSIPRPARSCAPSSPTASSPASRGSTASCGTAPGKATRANCALIPATGEVLERLEMPAGVGVSGLESDGGDRFFCGGGPSGRLRTVRRPRGRAATAKP